MLYKDNKFWTIEYQTTWREKQYCKLSVKVQKMCQGEALRQVVALKTEGAHTIREHFYLRFGGTQSAQVKDRERLGWRNNTARYQLKYRKCVKEKR